MESWKLLKMGTVLSIFNNNSFLSSCDAAGNDENWDCGIWQWRAIVSSILLIEDPLFFVATVILFFYFPGRILHTKKKHYIFERGLNFLPIRRKIKLHFCCFKIHQVSRSSYSGLTSYASFVFHNPSVLKKIDLLDLLSLKDWCFKSKRGSKVWLEVNYPEETDRSASALASARLNRWTKPHATRNA